MSVPKISNFNPYMSQLKAITDPQKKFEEFDEITTRELSSEAFQVLMELSQNPGLYEQCASPTFSLGIFQPTYVSSILKATALCKKLSEKMMSSLSEPEKKRLWSECPQIDTYIDSKIYQTLSRIILAKNFVGGSSHPTHSLHPIYLEMKKFEEKKHELTCGCYNHIVTNFHFKMDGPPVTKIKTV